ncbi:MAG: DUF423 domain-containing protein [Saprospiraceae bacterium]
MNISKIKIVAIFGALAVILGAFGAHALKPLLNDAQTDVFRTATLYHFVHLMPMLVIAFLPSSSKVLHWEFLLILGRYHLLFWISIFVEYQAFDRW